MKIAAISLTRNDDLRLGAWREYYHEYKEEIFEHIVVDNGSSKEYLEQLKDTFPNSTIIELGYNGGCTGAYNAGIKHVFQNPEIDAIMLIGNDVKIEKGGIRKLYEILFSNEEYGMIGPVVLKRDSDIIESCGIDINLKTGKSTTLEAGIPLPDVPIKERIVSCVPGGVNMAKVEMYKKVGLQDDNLFMYCDERDMGIRIKREGYNEVVTSAVACWHQHVNFSSGSTRSPVMRYLMGRNFVYLSKKHFSKRTQVIDFVSRFMRQTGLVVKNISNQYYRENYRQYVKGMFAGLRGNMDNSFMQDK